MTPAKSTPKRKSVTFDLSASSSLQKISLSKNSHPLDANFDAAADRQTQYSRSPLNSTQPTFISGTPPHDSQTKIILSPSQSSPTLRRKRHSLSFSVDYSEYSPTRYSGKNTLFNRYKSCYFLLHYKIFSRRVYTNNPNFHDFSCFSDRRKPNFNFVISSFINGVFRFLNFHKLYSSSRRNIYFKIIRRHLLTTFKAVGRRLNSPFSNNNQTRTFFRFSVDKQTYYFGFYFPCNYSFEEGLGRCHIPPTFVTKNACLCFLHWPWSCRNSTPSPPSHCSVMSNVPKRIMSRRLGIIYTKEISYSPGRDRCYVVCRDLCPIPNRSSHQKLRFDRLTRSPSSHDFRKLLTFNKDRTVIPCKHRPVFPVLPARREPSPPSPRAGFSINLTNLVPVFFPPPSPPPAPHSTSLRFDPSSPRIYSRIVDSSTSSGHISTFVEPPEWNNDDALDPIEAVLPLPPGFKRRRPGI
jgi:hypothetical protein